MGKFYGEIGFAITEETSPGIYEEIIKKRNYKGDLIRIYKHSDGNLPNDTISLNNQISIIADPFAEENFMNIRYIKYLNCKWKITGVEINRPRLILSFGGRYNDEN